MPIPFEKSFASIPKHIHWSKKNKKQPSECRKSSNKKYLFDCEKCFHEFEISLRSITSNHWCVFCANKKLCNDENCETCLKKSFASHPRVIHWSKKNVQTPLECHKSSNKKYLFDCEKCFHEFEISLNSITNTINCGFCANRKLCNDENCETCLKKSFASHPRAIHWSKKNDNTPREYFKSSHSKCLFDCEKCGHDFESIIYNITRGYWCPKCVNKTETKLYEIMIKIYQSIITQFKQDWCKNEDNNYYLRFDFCIPEHNIIIELDGGQHFIQVGKWRSPEEQFKTDKYKEKCANENGYSTIRIIQEDVWGDKYDWCKELCEAIEHIKNGDNQRYENVDSKNTRFHKVVNIYLCKNNEYDKFTK